MSVNSTLPPLSALPRLPKVLSRGMDAFAQGALVGGLHHFFATRIEPLRHLNDFLNSRLHGSHGRHVEAESTIAAIHMVFGAAAAGSIPLTLVDSPGFARIQEGISYLASAGLGAVILNVMRAGPGAGNLSPAQGDFVPAVKGGGHGDYKSLVLAPSSAQEMFDFGFWAFHLARRYGNPVVVLADGATAHLMEPLRPIAEAFVPADPPSLNSVGGCRQRARHHISTLEMNETNFEVKNYRLFDKYAAIQQDFAGDPLAEQSHETIDAEGCDILLVTYGFLSRIAKTTHEKAHRRGLKVGLFCPKVLWPFPRAALNQAARRAKVVLVAEMSMGQFSEEVRLQSDSPEKIKLYARTGGRIPSAFELLNVIKSILEEK